MFKSSIALLILTAQLLITPLAESKTPFKWNKYVGCNILTEQQYNSGEYTNYFLKLSNLLDSGDFPALNKGKSIYTSFSISIYYNDYESGLRNARKDPKHLLSPILIKANLAALASEKYESEPGAGVTPRGTFDCYVSRLNYEMNQLTQKQINIIFEK